MKGQKYELCHAGISNVSRALHISKCRITEPINEIGGHNQLLYPLQLAVNASTFDVPGQ